MKESYKITVNGLEIIAQYDIDKINEVFVPLMKKWTEMHKKENRRIIVMLAAAPGVGKSTLSLFLQQLSEQREDITNIQAVAMDGFFYMPEYLKSHYLPDGKRLLQEMKGAPETYDVPAFVEKIKEAKKEKESWWPTYNRANHCPEPNTLLVNGDIVLIEGNYLLLNEKPWDIVKDLADDTIFITTDPDCLKERLVGRKAQSGHDLSFSEQFFYNVDRVNAIRINENSCAGNTNLVMNANGDYLPLNIKKEDV